MATPSVGDIVRLTVNGGYLNQTMLNVQMFRADEVGVDADYTFICNAYQSKWATYILPFLSDQYGISNIRAENLTDGIGLGFSDLDPVIGEVSGDAMPPFVTWSFLQVRATGLTRHGHKYVGGIPESAITNGVTIFDSTALDNFIQVFANPLASDSGGPTDFVLTPVIVGRTLNDDVPPKYEIDLSKVNDIVTVSYRGVSTENSRKFGRGV